MEGADSHSSFPAVIPSAPSVSQSVIFTVPPRAHPSQRSHHARCSGFHELDAALSGWLRRRRGPGPWHTPASASRASTLELTSSFWGFRPHRRPLRICSARLHFANRFRAGAGRRSGSGRCVLCVPISTRLPPVSFYPRWTWYSSKTPGGAGSGTQTETHIHGTSTQSHTGREHGHRPRIPRPNRPTDTQASHSTTDPSHRHMAGKSGRQVTHTGTETSGGAGTQGKNRSRSKNTSTVVEVVG